MPRIVDLLGNHFCDPYHIDPEQEYTIEMVPAVSLLVYNRLDVIAKYIYVAYYVNHYDMKFAREVYKRHLEVMTDGAFIEIGQGKHSFKNYIKIFEELIEDIKEHGVDCSRSIIPVGRDNSIMDGAHRTAIAAYFGMDVPIVRFDWLYPQHDAASFINKDMNPKYVDYLVSEYVKLKKNIYIACFWPRAMAQEKSLSTAAEMLADNFSVVYTRDVKLNYQGLKNFILQIYCDQEWVGGVENGFQGAEGKTDACYAADETVRVCIIEGGELQKVVQIKKEIRGIFKLGNHSVHITDTQEQAVQIVDLILNENSLDLMNRGKPTQDIKLNKMIDNFRDAVEAKGLQLEKFIIDASAVMGLYGIRPCTDIDYLTLEELSDEEKGLFGDCHEEYLKYHKKTKDALIMNPENYLVYHKVKFITLGVLSEFKKNRGEEKDIYDNILIEKSNNAVIAPKDKRLLFKIKIRRMKRNISNRILYFGIDLLKRWKLYEKVRKIYHLIKR